MRLRMYVTLPDVASARKLADELLLARIEDTCRRPTRSMAPSPAW